MQWKYSIDATLRLMWLEYQLVAYIGHQNVIYIFHIWLHDCSKIKFVSFAIGNIFGCNNLCHLSCDFYDYVVEKDKWFVLLHPTI